MKTFREFFINEKVDTFKVGDLVTIKSKEELEHEGFTFNGDEIFLSAKDAKKKSGGYDFSSREYFINKRLKIVGESKYNNELSKPNKFYILEKENSEYLEGDGAPAFMLKLFKENK
jgi:hypothetical protein